MADFEMLHKHWDGYTGGAGKDVLDLILYTEALVAALRELIDTYEDEGGDPDNTHYARTLSAPQGEEK